MLRYGFLKWKEETNNDYRRFYQMMRKLPLELVLRISHFRFGSRKVSSPKNLFRMRMRYWFRELDPANMVIYKSELPIMHYKIWVADMKS